MSETVEEAKLVQNSIFADFRKSHKCLIMNGANDRIRTDDLRITNALLYRLSYIGLRISRNLIRFSEIASDKTIISAKNLILSGTGRSGCCSFLSYDCPRPSIAPFW